MSRTFKFVPLEPTRTGSPRLEDEMRVLFAITKGDVGGAQRHVEILVDGLLARGHVVHAICEVPSPLAQRLSRAGATVVPWPDIVREPNPVRDLRARNQLSSCVRELTPDVLHLHSAKAGVLGRGLLRPPMGITVYTCHHASFGPGRRPLHRVIGRAMEQASLRFLDGIITVGTRDAPALRRMAPQVPLRVVRNAVPVDGPPCASLERTPRALWVARMQHPKDPLMAIAAWERVVARHPDAELQLAGTGPLEQRVRAAIASSPVAHRIRYEGFVPDLRQAYADANVFLLTSHVEGGTTMATLEAMSHGLIPVVTDAGDAAMLPRCGAGVVARRSADSVADAVIELFDHPERLGVLRDGALHYARQRFTPTTMLEGTLSAYADFLRRAGLASRAGEAEDLGAVPSRRSA